MDEIINKLMTTVAALTETVAANTVQLEALNAGREQALAQMQGAAGATGEKPATRRRSSKPDETPAPGTTPAAAETPAPATTAPATTAPATTIPAAPTASEDDVRAAAGAYIGGAGTDAEAKQARAANLKTITEHFGTKTLVGPTGIETGEQRAQALFYIKRFDSGAEVNFSADYDFAGDPAQGGTAPAAGGDDFDIG